MTWHSFFMELNQKRHLITMVFYKFVRNAINGQRANRIFFKSHLKVRLHFCHGNTGKLAACHRDVQSCITSPRIAPDFDRVRAKLPITCEILLTTCAAQHPNLVLQGSKAFNCTLLCELPKAIRLHSALPAGVHESDGSLAQTSISPHR